MSTKETFADDAHPVPVITLFAPQTVGRDIPIVLVAHGFTAHSRWGFYPYVCSSLSKDAAVLMVDFSMNGYARTHDVDTEAFAQNTVSREVDELSNLIKRIRRTPECYIPMEVCKSLSRHVHILGHSRGASVSLLAALVSDDITSVCCWSPVADFMRFSQRQCDEWRKTGFRPATSDTASGLRSNVLYLDDIERNRERFRLATLLKQSRFPVHVITGGQDMVTTPRSIEKAVAESFRTDVKVNIIPTAG
ncbi:MAG: alpha/beta hydrolase, partial [Candidatus Kapabacteria bacterium]|nr:alpha/beta hydrolase [Candidatus Kapabacteria bacterium]